VLFLHAYAFFAGYLSCLFCNTFLLSEVTNISGDLFWNYSASAKLAVLIF
jgi:hypothetical protein